MSTSHEAPTLVETLKTLVTSLPTVAASQHCLIGALALSAWGQIRATQDIDLMVLFDNQTREELIEALATAGFRYDTRWTEQNPLLRAQVLRFRFGNYPVDLLAPRDAHDRETLARRRLIPLGDFSVWTCSPEDLMLLKLKVGRPQDFEDVLGIVRHQRANLSHEHLWNWADRMGLQGELHYVLGGEKPIPE